MASLKDYVERAKEKGFTKEDLISALTSKGYSKQEIDEAFGVEKKSVPVKKGEDKTIFDRFVLLFSHPNTFFQTVRDEGIGTSSLMVLCSIFGFMIVYFLFQFLVSFIELFRFSNSFLIGSFVLIPIIFVSIYLYSGVLYFISRSSKGKGTFTDTFNLYSYSVIPSILLILIPLLNFFGIIYSIVLLVYGLKEYHGFSGGKAFGIFIASFIPFLVLVLGFFIILFYLRPAIF